MQEENSTPTLTCGICSTTITKDDYHCKKCGQYFCKKHVGSTKIYQCSKCKSKYLHEDAQFYDGICQAIMNSRCSKCGKMLFLGHTKSGTYFIMCTTCDFTRFGSGEREKELNDTEFHGEAKSPRTCEGKLMRIDDGKDFCLACLKKLLNSYATVNFSKIGSELGIKKDIDVLRVLKNLNTHSDELGMTVEGSADYKNKIWINVRKNRR